MSQAERRAQQADELLRRFVATLRAGQLYSPDHPIVARNIEGLAAAAGALHEDASSVVIGIVGDEMVVDDRPVSKADTLVAFMRRLRELGVERVTIDRGVTAAELGEFVNAVAAHERPAPDVTSQFPSLAHIRVGRVVVREGLQTRTADIGSFRRMYGEAVSVAEVIWESARAESRPDATVARRMIDDLAHAVVQNRTALLALTTLKSYDNYTFTHMVNVSILTMGQARSLGVDGPLLREFGLAALMHDVGKVRTPLEILTKPDKLTPQEFAVMKRHTVDGAEMLRETPDIPTLAPVVAFEHHLRMDGSGYPDGVSRSPLNLCTMLCAISDVYDAMRSKRGYQDAFPSERILEVLKRNDGRQLDPHLVRRFSQLIGIYPVGNLVRLDTGEMAIVTAIYAADPRRPKVRVLADSDGVRVAVPYEVELWMNAAGGEWPSTVAAPIDPASLGVDPLALL